MTLSPLAGQPAPAEVLIDIDRLVSRYYERRPDPNDPQQLVHFGTSGHRGTPEEGTFTEAHILAISQAICDYRASQGISGPLFMGKDTHAVSAKLTAAPGGGEAIGGLKVLTTNGWFAARPSGTENIYKIYAESFKDQGHLAAIVKEAQEIVNHALKSFDSGDRSGRPANE